MLPLQVFMFVCLTISLFSILLASHQAFIDRQATAWLALPVAWAVYNAVPPLLFFGYLLLSTPALQVRRTACRDVLAYTAAAQCMYHCSN